MEVTGVESLEIDRGAFYSGQRPTAEETGKLELQESLASEYKYHTASVA